MSWPKAAKDAKIQWSNRELNLAHYLLVIRSLLVQTFFVAPNRWSNLSNAITAIGIEEKVNLKLPPIALIRKSNPLTVSIVSKVNFVLINCNLLLQICCRTKNVMRPPMNRLTWEHVYNQIWVFFSWHTLFDMFRLVILQITYPSDGK